jgi:hypothetical protein
MSVSFVYHGWFNAQRRRNATSHHALEPRQQPEVGWSLDWRVTGWAGVLCRRIGDRSLRSLAWTPRANNNRSDAGDGSSCRQSCDLGLWHPWLRWPGGGVFIFTPGNGAGPGINADNTMFHHQCWHDRNRFSSWSCSATWHKVNKSAPLFYGTSPAADRLPPTSLLAHAKLISGQIAEIAWHSHSFVSLPEQLVCPASCHILSSTEGRGSSVVVKALCNKPERREFETRWREWIFSVYLILLAVWRLVIL